MWKKCYFNSRLSILTLSIVFSVTRLFSSPSQFFLKIFTERFGQAVSHLVKTDMLSHYQKQSACHFAFFNSCSLCQRAFLPHVTNQIIFIKIHLIHDAFWWWLFLISNPSCYNCSNYSIIIFLLQISSVLFPIKTSMYLQSGFLSKLYTSLWRLKWHLDKLVPLLGFPPHQNIIGPYRWMLCLSVNNPK